MLLQISLCFFIIANMVSSYSVSSQNRLRMYFCCGCRRVRIFVINGWLSVCRSRFFCFTSESIIVFSVVFLVSRVNCSFCLFIGVSLRSRKQTIIGLRQARVRFSILRVIVGVGGLEISVMILVCGSFFSISMASSIIRSSIFSFRSRSSVLISCETSSLNL